MQVKRPTKGNVKQACGREVWCSLEYSVKMGNKQGNVVSFTREKGYAL